MAYVNVAEWSPDQVTDWLKGLDSVIWNYVPYFLNNEIVGKTLLQMRPDLLQKLGMNKIGHQELILEAVGHLRNFHYDLDRENLQHLALKLSTAATSLYRELCHCEDSSKLETRILSSVTHTIATIKPLACWLDRSPFSGQSEFTEKRANLLKLAIDMATNGQRDRFADKPVAEISRMANQLAKLADEIIQDISDPMLLQPASLDLVTLKKRENDLGFSILPNYHGSLQISDIKFGSPAHVSGKIEEGDEIVQVNYQTVVGWQRQKVLMLFQESPPDVLLTLKKRPKHTKIYGQIYMKPYRLPSKKRVLPFTRWHDNLPSPRPELLAIPDFGFSLSRNIKPNPEPIVDISDSSDSDSDILTNQSPTVQNIMCDTTRSYLPKPRSVLQRRNTISGSSSFYNRGNCDIKFWRELKQSINHTGSSYDTHQLENDITLSDPLSLRDKSVSCGYGLELSPRPKTVACVGLNAKVNNKPKEEKQLTNTFKTEIKCFISGEGKVLENKTDEICDQKNLKSVRFDTIKKNSETCLQDIPVITNIDHIPFVDDENINADIKNELVSRQLGSLQEDYNYNLENTQVKFVYPQSNTQDDSLQTTVQNATIKSLSSTSKDYRSPNTDLKPVVEPRTIFHYAPSPPPRPLNTLKPVVASRKILQSSSDSKITSPKTNFDTKAQSSITGQTSISPVPKLACNDNHIIPSKTIDNTKSSSPSVMSLLGKTRNIRKKNSLLNKRRLISAKVLLQTVPPPNKQGWLYQRLRSKNHEVPKWEKRLFILIDSTLYGFSSSEASRASCMLLLPGYTVSLATEVKSRDLAFRVYHTGTAFYFSAENQDELMQWLQVLGQATLSLETFGDLENSKLYSESETSDDEKDHTDLNENSDQTTRKHETKNSSAEKVNKSDKSHNLKFGSLKKFTKQKHEDSSGSSTSLDRKYLRFFSKNSEKSKNIDKSSTKPNCDMPIPTAQYRSYRKIQQNILSPGPNYPDFDNSMNIENARINSEVKDNISIVNEPTKKHIKIPNPINYMHASNPNLVDFDATDFANKTHQFKSPLEKSPLSSDSLSGFVTLEQFMLNKQKEETVQAYSNRVICGVETNKFTDIEASNRYTDKPNDDLHKQLQKIVPDVIYGQLHQDTKSLPRRMPNTERILPKTPDTYPAKKQTFKSLPRKLFQNQFDDGYEIIHINDEDNALNTSQFKPTQKDKKYEKSANQFSKDCIPMTAKVELMRRQFSSEEKRYGFLEDKNNVNPISACNIEKSSKSNTQLKPVTQYIPMNLPIRKISNQMIDINLDKR